MKRSVSVFVSVFFLALSAAALERPFGEDPALPSRTVEGTVEAVYLDDFEGGRSELAYHLVTDEGRRLSLAFAGDEAQPYRTGDRLRVAGRETAAGRFEVETAERVSTAEPLSTEALATFTTGAKRILLIRYNFANDTSQPYSDATSQNVMFGPSGSVAAFYAEGSYGLTTHSGSITPWLTVSSNKPTTCDISSYSQASSLASTHGFNPANYDFVVYVFPHIPCGWAGLGVVGGSGAWINQSLSTYVVSHELGHNYGLMHAHSWDCGLDPISPSCVRSEYGDPFDTMGGSLRQFNAFNKAAELGWLTGSSVATRSSGSQTYTLMPLESGSGLRALQLPTSVPGRTYWVEFRQAIGFDSGLSSNANVMNGALIHLGPSATSGTDLLDMTPGTNTFADAALDVGLAFTDAAAGLTITTVSKSGSTLNVRVNFGPVVPTANFTFSPASPVAGQTVSFHDTSSGIPTSWSWNFGDSATSTQQNPTHIYAAAGTYTVSLRASNGLGSSVPVTHTVTVAGPPTPTVTSLTASPALPQPAGATIIWTATATGGIAPLQYAFYLLNVATSSWSLPKPYSTSNTWSWTPTQPGQYAVQVWVKNSGSTALYDAWKGSGTFTITSSTTPTVTSLTASPALPKPAGTTITWTATATGGIAPLQYAFYLYNVATSSWSLPKPYSTSNTWSWTPTQPGQYAVQVWVKNNGSTSPYDAWKGSGTFSVTP